MKNNNANISGGVAAIIIILFVAILGFSICVPLFTQDVVTLHVTKKDTYTTTSCSSDSDGHTSCSTNIHNVLYTDGEILQFNDNLILWVWGSQTSFSHVVEGKTYTFKVYGFNVSWLNWYRSVISYEEL